MRFVGDVKPTGHLLQMLTGTARLVERARDDGARGLVIDSSGFVSPSAARELQHQLIDLLRPNHLVALQRGGELDPLLRPFEPRPAIACHRLPAAPRAQRRSIEQRRRYRAERFAAYFGDAREQAIDIQSLGVHGRAPALDAPNAWRYRLVALLDAEGFVLALCVVRRLEPGGNLRLLTPPFERARMTSLHVGSLTLNPRSPIEGPDDR